jgi:hypothetical protein
VVMSAGKRISMRKVIAYIASHFRKDKIWLRRSRPDKRRYQVRVLGGRGRGACQQSPDSIVCTQLICRDVNTSSYNIRAHMSSYEEGVRQDMRCVIIRGASTWYVY